MWYPGIALNFLIGSHEYGAMAALASSGAIIVLISSSLFLWASSREHICLYYFLFVSISALYALVSQILAAIIPAVAGLGGDELAALLRIMVPVSAIVFTCALLQTATVFPRIDGLLKTSVLLLAMLILGGLTRIISFGVFLTIQNSLYLLVGVMLAVICGFAVIKGQVPARYLLAGLVIYLACLIMQFLAARGAAHPDPLNGPVPLAGELSEMLLMYFALLSRIRERSRQQLDPQEDHKSDEAQRLHHLIRIICHDIANPLAIICGKCEWAMRNGRRDEVLDVVLKSGWHIGDIVNYVRKYEAFESGKMQVTLSPEPLGVIFDALDFLYHKRSAEKGIDLAFSLDDTSLKVLADKVILTNEILGNLISNAIKFSSAGKKISVDTVSSAADVLIRVRDQGVGMDPDHLAHIFDPSKATSKHGTAGEKGTGFGMPLVARCVKDHEGSITITSVPAKNGAFDHGTSIEIRLKRAF